MKLIRVLNLEEIVIEEDIAVAIGNFDGLHKGHMSIINKIKESSYKTAIITFDPHPSFFFNKDFKMIISSEDKYSLLNDIDYIISIKFDSKLANSSPEDFVFFLKNNHTKLISCDSSFTFGQKRIGSVELLKKSFNVLEVSDYKYKNEKVSSSLIRNFISLGKIEDANKLLFKRYFLKGRVIKGRQKGRLIGFPTVNLRYDDSIILPKTGVYITRTFVDNSWYLSMTNVGVNPTFNKVDTKSIETYILDFDDTIYDKEIVVEFYKFLRDEKKFNNVDELILELHKNKAEIVKYFESLS